MSKLVARWLGVIAFMAFAGHGQPALALGGDPENWCRGGMFAMPLGPELELQLGRVVGKGRAELLSDLDGCPQAGAQCRKNGAVSVGTLVAVLPSGLPGLICVYAAGPRENVTGWLPNDRVTPLPVDRRPAMSAWKGRWQALGGNTIVLTPVGGGQLGIKGQAYWPGKGIPPMNIGSLAGTITPRGNHAAYVEDNHPMTCRATLTLLSHSRLAVRDNRVCGGANVSFGDVYWRVPYRP